MIYVKRLSYEFQRILETVSVFLVGGMLIAQVSDLLEAFPECRL